MVENEAPDDWSWEVVSSEFKILMNNRLENKSIALENRIICEYLTQKCRGCLENPCFDYHPGQKQRRKLVSLGPGIWNYSSKKCLVPRCNHNLCQFSHTAEESLFHPDKYKKEKCKSQSKNGECELYGYFCPFKHADSDDFQENSGKFDFETFKTIKCEIKKLHSYSTCVFYHENLKFNDKRRNFKLFNYSLETCPQFESCEEGDKCKFCHSDIEFRYHPSRFKTRPCNLRNNCRNKETCPYFHDGFGDKMILQVTEYRVIMLQYQEKLEKCRKLQKTTLILDRFLCSACREAKCQVIMKCGHSRCLNCKIISYCFLCECETSTLVEINFD